MAMDPTTGLPDRDEIVRAVEEMIADGERPVVFAVAVGGYDTLADAGPDEAAAALREVASRLGRLVRASDVLSMVGPGVFCLAGSGVQRPDVSALLDRIRGVFALPVQVGPHAVSFPVTVGIAHPVVGIGAEAMLAEAEADLRRRLAET